MRQSEFEIQDRYCKENNTPEDNGCDNCLAIDKEHCADALRNLCGKWLTNLHTDKKEFDRCAKELERVYG